MYTFISFSFFCKLPNTLQKGITLLIHSILLCFELPNLVPNIILCGHSQWAMPQIVLPLLVTGWILRDPLRAVMMMIIIIIIIITYYTGVI